MLNYFTGVLIPATPISEHLIPDTYKHFKPAFRSTRHYLMRSNRPVILCRENTSDRGTCHRSVIIEREQLFAPIRNMIAILDL